VWDRGAEHALLVSEEHFLGSGRRTEVTLAGAVLCGVGVLIVCGQNVHRDGVRLSQFCGGEGKDGSQPT
jgi:hypothetical protein